MRRAQRRHYTNRAGLTIIELLLFSAIFAVTSLVFITILLVIMRIQLRETGNAEVNQQTQFLIQTLQYRIERSYLIDIPADTATTTLTLRMPTGTDPTVIYAASSSGITGLYFTESTGPSQRLTSDRVNLSNVSFIRRRNPPGHDSVIVAFTMNYVTQNPQQQAAKTVNFSIARSGNVPFDSDLLDPPANNVIGSVPGEWRSINETIFLSTNGNVGIGTPNPTSKLDIAGNLRFIGASGTSTCDATRRGTIWYSPGGTDVKDTLSVCYKNTSDGYVWGTLY